jgi:hypothetical protein
MGDRANFAVLSGLCTPSIVLAKFCPRRYDPRLPRADTKHSLS